MQNTDDFQAQAIEKLKEIMRLSYPHCKDGNPNEDDFVKINDAAHRALMLVVQLRIEKSV